MQHAWPSPPHDVVPEVQVPGVAVVISQVGLAVVLVA